MRFLIVVIVFLVIDLTGNSSRALAFNQDNHMLTQPWRYRTVTGEGPTTEQAIDQAYKHLAKSIWADVTSETIQKIEVTTQTKEYFRQSLSTHTKAKLFNIDFDVKKEDGQYVATATLDLVVLTQAYVEYLMPLKAEVEQVFGKTFKSKAPLEKFRLYQQYLNILRDFEVAQVLVLTVEQFNQAPRFNIKFKPPNVSYYQAVSYFDSLKDNVISSGELAALIVNWQIDKQRLEGAVPQVVEVCPIYGQDGRQLTRAHQLPANLAIALKEQTRQIEHNRLVGKAFKQQHYHRIEFYLVKPDLSHQLLASVKVNFDKNQWVKYDNKSNAGKFSRVLLKIDQHYVDNDGNPLPVKQIYESPFIEYFTEKHQSYFSNPPQWLEHDKCLVAPLFNQLEQALHHQADYVLVAQSNTNKSKSIESDNIQLSGLQYATTDLSVRLSQINHKTHCFTSSDTWSGFLEDNNMLLKKSIHKALQSLGKQRKNCTIKSLFINNKQIQQASLVTKVEHDAQNHLTYDLDKFEFKHSFRHRAQGTQALVANQYLQAMQAFKQSYQTLKDQKSAYFYLYSCKRAKLNAQDCQPLTSKLNQQGHSNGYPASLIQSKDKPILSLYSKTPKLGHYLAKQLGNSTTLLSGNDQSIVIKNEILRLTVQFRQNNANLTAIEKRDQILIHGHKNFLIAELFSQQQTKDYIQAEVLVTLLDLLTAQVIDNKAFFSRLYQPNSEDVLFEALATDISHYALAKLQQVKQENGYTMRVSNE